MGSGPHLQCRDGWVGHEPDSSKSSAQIGHGTWKCTEARQGPTANRTLCACNGGSNSILVKCWLAVRLPIAAGRRAGAAGRRARAARRAAVIIPVVVPMPVVVRPVIVAAVAPIVLAAMMSITWHAPGVVPVRLFAGVSPVAVAVALTR
eukprot:scaffold6732_cov99-Isochrysis_galbana.AAC.3